MKAKNYVVPMVTVWKVQCYSILDGSASGEIDPWQSKESCNFIDEMDGKEEKQ